MKRILTTTAILFLTAGLAYSQVGINTETPGSTLDVKGTFATNVATNNSTNFALDNDYFVAWNGTADGIATLPAALSGSANFKGRIYVIKNSSQTYSLTVKTSGSELIEEVSDKNTSSLSLGSGEALTIISTGSTTATGVTWQIISRPFATPAISIPGAISGVYEFLGSSVTPLVLNAGQTGVIPMNTATITLNKESTLLITYSALPVPVDVGLSTQGTINLKVDGVQQISSYFSATDGVPNTRLGNHSTSQKIVTLGAGTHDITLEAKCWVGKVRFNTNPVTFGYAGALSTDVNSMVSRVSVIAFNR